jgi:hypothetical protein
VADGAYDGGALSRNLAERSDWANVKPMRQRKIILAVSVFSCPSVVQAKRRKSARIALELASISMSLLVS